MDKLTKVQIETLRSSKNSKKLTEMSRNEGVQLTPGEIGHVFAKETFPCEEDPANQKKPEDYTDEKEIAPYGRTCKYKLQVNFVSINGAAASACRWCGVEFNNDCCYLSSEAGEFYCNYLSTHTS